MFQVKKSNNLYLFPVICRLLITGALLLPPINIRHCSAQNLYDLGHSKSFAAHLFGNKEYSLAAEEYERVLHLNPDDTSSRLMLIKSYEKSDNYPNVLVKAVQLYPAVQFMPCDFAFEYEKTLLLARQYSQFDSLINKNNCFQDEQKNLLLLSASLMENRWDNALQRATHLKPEKNKQLLNLQTLAFSTLDLNPKSPALSMCLSALIPGSGKVYAGYWKDGLVSFIFVAASGFQAYRGFEKQGARSVYGWIFAGLSTSFYLGNIFGSGKAAHQHNILQKEKIRNEAERILHNMD